MGSFLSGKLNTSNSSREVSRSQASILQSENLICFSKIVLEKATENFNPDGKLGDPMFGSVFKGWIDQQSLAATGTGTGTPVAVKRLLYGAIHTHNQIECLAEIIHLGQLKHPNLVRLIGYCLEGDCPLLVYEFVPQGSLKNHLFEKGSNFQWNRRIKVAIGAAKGLAYLHTYLHSPIAKARHLDFNPSSILIDYNYNAKLSNFGLGMETHAFLLKAKATPYFAPEYMATGVFTPKSEIYSFGLVLLEILTGRRCRDETHPSKERDLVMFAKPFLTNKRKILQIMDPNIEGQYSSTVASQAALVVIKCLKFDPTQRPNAQELVKALEELQKASESFTNAYEQASTSDEV